MTRGLRGLPPFAPLVREAAAFAVDVACPPFRPSATAAGCLAMLRHPFVGRDFFAQCLGGVAIGRLTRALGAGQQHLESVRAGLCRGAQLVRRELIEELKAACGVHVSSYKPKRLGLSTANRIALEQEGA